MTNAEKQAHYRGHHLGGDGEKTLVELNAGTRSKMGRLANNHGYTITDLRGTGRARRTAGDGKAALLRAQGLLRCRMPRLWYNYISDAGAMSMT
jgi:hypothetical protein